MIGVFLHPLPSPPYLSYIPSLPYPSSLTSPTPPLLHPLPSPPSLTSPTPPYLSSLTSPTSPLLHPLPLLSYIPYPSSLTSPPLLHPLSFPLHSPARNNLLLSTIPLHRTTLPPTHKYTSLHTPERPSFQKRKWLPFRFVAD